MIKQGTIDQIFSAASIEDVIGDFVTLKKSGSGLIGLCPFHNEKTPSFSVSPSKGIYKCFGCGRAGNVVGFLMEHEGLNYVEALKNLAARYHIEIEEDNSNKEELDEKARERDSLYVALEFAKNYFHENLNDGIGKDVGKAYFLERGIQPATIEEFGLGYALPEWRAFSDHALGSEFSEDVLLKAGLIKKKEKEDGEARIYDTFRDRVMFPIRNLMGKVVGFGGRQLKKEEKSPKYINSPETAVYNKSQILYGLSKAKHAIRDADKAYLVEGYMDVITLFQSGIKNVVASSGTSLTEGQIKQIKRFTSNVTMLFDGDAAGAKASMRGVDLLLASGMNVHVVTFPEGEDPDSYCRKMGGAGLQEFIDREEKDFMLFKADFLKVDDHSDPIRKTEAIHSMLESIALIPDPIKRSFYVKECARLMETGEQLLHRELARIRRKGQNKQVQKIDRNLMEVEPEVPVEEKKAEQDNREYALVRSLVLYGNHDYDEEIKVAEFIFDELEADEYHFDSTEYGSLVEEAKAEWEKEESLDEEWFTRHPEFGGLAAKIIADKYDLSPAWGDKYEIFVNNEEENCIDEITANLLYLKLKHIEKSIADNTEELKAADTEEKIQEIMQMHSALVSIRQKIAEQLGSSAIK